MALNVEGRFRKHRHLNYSGKMVVSQMPDHGSLPSKVTFP
jgi:hypothetical protein